MSAVKEAAATAETAETADASVPRRLMPVLFIGVFMAALDTAIVAPAIPALRAQFGVDNRLVGLVTVVYVLFSMCSTAPIAALGDRHGRRPLFLGCISLFALGSLIVALAPTYPLLLLGRAVQGIGGGGIIPTASAVIADAWPAHRRGRALGLIGAVYGMAFVLGPPLAALVMVVASWQWIFLANLPIAAVVLALGSRALPAQPLPGGSSASRPHAARAPLDIAGIALVFALLGSLVLALTRAADRAFDTQGTAMWPWFAGAAAVLLPLLLWVERRAAQPLIPLSLFGRRRLALAYALTLGAGFGMGGVIFLSSIATLGHGVAPDHAGFALLPLVLCSMLASMVSGRMLGRVGVRPIIAAGFVLLALGYAASGHGGLGLWGFLAATMPVGLGVGIVVGGALRTVAIEEAPLAQRGAAQGLLNVFTSIGTLLAAAAIGAVADGAGGGAAGFSSAYQGVALVMAAMLPLALALRDTGTAPGTPSRAHG